MEIRPTLRHRQPAKGGSPADGINNIYFTNPSSLSNPRFVAETIIDGRLDICGNSIYANRIDIAISDTVTFAYQMGSSPINAGEVDFYTTILHELGHSLLLGHATPSPKIMVPSIQRETFFRSITNDDVAGLNNILNYSNIDLGSQVNCVHPVDNLTCVTSAFDYNLEKSNHEILVFGNPVLDKKLNFKLNGEISSNIGNIAL